ncbi:hypothetical protein HanRHA438_Chr11g0486831 [Helianthus annuus]|nr:hypothetical protein HanRHA438_Chr11g0486831 [Helianthus annuus]
MWPADTARQHHCLVVPQKVTCARRGRREGISASDSKVVIAGVVDLDPGGSGSDSSSRYREVPCTGYRVLSCNHMKISLEGPVRIAPRALRHSSQYHIGHDV